MGSKGELSVQSVAKVTHTVGKILWILFSDYVSNIFIKSLEGNISLCPYTEITQS